MVFDSIVKLTEFYKMYGKETWFEVCKRTSSKGDDGELKYMTVACSRFGKEKCKSKNSFKLHQVIKMDCKA